MTDRFYFSNGDSAGSLEEFLFKAREMDDECFSHHVNKDKNDFANKNIEQVIAIAPRTEPLHTPIERVEKTTHTTNWGHTYTNTRIITSEV